MSVEDADADAVVLREVLAHDDDDGLRELVMLLQVVAESEPRTLADEVTVGDLVTLLQADVDTDPLSIADGDTLVVPVGNVDLLAEALGEALEQPVEVASNQ